MAPMKSRQKADGVVIVVTCMLPGIHKHVCGGGGSGGGDDGPESFEMPSAVCTYKTYSLNHSHTGEKSKIKCVISCSKLMSHICLNAHADWHILERALDLERHVLLS